MIAINLYQAHRPESLTDRIERFAVMLWTTISAGAEFGRNCERERLLDAANAMHAVRMVTVGRARDTADTLYELAWSRVHGLDQSLRAELREMAGERRHVA